VKTNKSEAKFEVELLALATYVPYVRAVSFELT
jgi:hypothetical protein